MYELSHNLLMWYVSLCVTPVTPYVIPLSIHIRIELFFISPVLSEDSMKLFLSDRPCESAPGHYITV